MLFQAYNQNGVWKTGDGSSNSIIVHMIVADIYKSKRENLANSLEDMFGEDFKVLVRNFFQLKVINGAVFFERCVIEI